MRFGNGDIDGGWSKFYARQCFLEMIDELRPDVRRSLIDLRTLIPSDLITQQLPELLRSPETVPGFKWRPELDDLLDEVDEWQQRWHLTNEWLWWAAVATLVNNKRWIVPGFLSHSYRRDGDFQYSFDLAYETEEEAIERLKNAFLNDHIPQLKQAMKDIKHDSPKALVKDDTKHFEWLVLFQVCEMQQKEIAHKYYPDTPDEITYNGDNALQNPTRQVRREITRLAEFIGITLRYVPRGRKREEA